MREDLLNELENEYAQMREDDLRIEEERRGKIRDEYPEIERLAQERQSMILNALGNIAKGKFEEKERLTERMESLSAAIREKLAENGFPQDYLAPVYRCPLCEDTGRVGETVKEYCECLKRAYQQKLREKIGLKSDRAETFETFDINVFPEEPIPGQKYNQREQMRYNRKVCEEWADSYPDTEKRNLLMTGPSGTGKTFLMRAMADRLITRGINVLIISAYSFLETARKSYFEGAEGLEELLETEVLMIDDLGSEPMMQNVTIEQLFNLINERQNLGLTTVISSNLNIEELRGRYTERVVSRLSNGKKCQVIPLCGRDVRKAER